MILCLVEQHRRGGSTGRLQNLTLTCELLKILDPSLHQMTKERLVNTGLHNLFLQEESGVRKRSYTEPVNMSGPLRRRRSRLQKLNEQNNESSGESSGSKNENADSTVR